MNHIFLTFILIFFFEQQKFVISDDFCSSKLDTTKYNKDTSLPSCSYIPGYFWDLSQCSACTSENCFCQDYCNCDSCKSGYYLDSNTSTCQQCPDGCEVCCQRKSLTEYICSQCKRDYTLVGGICIYSFGCKQLIQNTDKCKQCLDGFYLDRDSKCQQCHKNCQTCLTQYDCVTCKSTQSNTLPRNLCVKLDDDSAPPNQSPSCDVTNIVNDSNCLDSSDSSYFLDFSSGKCFCKKCKEEYYQKITYNTQKKLLEYACGPCEDVEEAKKTIKRCIQDYPDLVHIIECKENFVLDLYPKSRKCVDNTVKKCRRLFAGDCSDCYQGYYPEYYKKDADSTGEINCFQIQVKNCKVPINQGKECKQCEDGYYLQKRQDENGIDSCIQCDSSCLKCSSATECLQCNSGYRLSDKKCSSCVNQYCSQCNQIENVCTKCKEEYGLNTQSKDETDQCLKCQDNCLTCDVDFRKCTQCKSGYYIQNFVCKKQPDNCILQESGFCIQCAFGYIAQGGYCIKCSNQDIGYYICPIKCDDSSIELVELLNSQKLNASVGFYLIIYFAIVMLSQFISFR